MTDDATYNPYLKKGTAPKASSDELIDDAVHPVGAVPASQAEDAVPVDRAEEAVPAPHADDVETENRPDFSGGEVRDVEPYGPEVHDSATPGAGIPRVEHVIVETPATEVQPFQFHGAEETSAEGTSGDEPAAANGADADALQNAMQLPHSDSPYPSSASGIATQLGEPQRVHRLTPFLQFWRAIVLGVLFLIFQVVQDGLDLALGGIQDHIHGVLIGLGIALLVLLVVGAVFWFASGLWWRRISFTVDADEVTVRRGLFSKVEKSARREKIQAVDVVEALVPRLFGLAEVRIETAGGTESSLKIFYLEKHRAEMLRAELTGQGVEPQNELPVARTIAAAALESLWLILGVIVSLLTVPALLIPILIGLLPNLWRLFDMSWRFTADIDDSLRITYGLANRRRQSIPLDRIHAVELSQPLLWRIPGWWRIRATAIGYETTSVILPVATLDEAKDFAAQLGVPLNDVPITPTYRSPNRAKWVSPLAYKRQVVETGEFITIFGGRLIRRSATIRGIHIQELSLSQGPIQRKLRLKNLRLDLVRGAVKMTARDLDESDADALLGILRRRETKLMNQ